MATANTRIVNGINTRVLHNKDYVEVNERVRILHELRKSGEIKDFEMVESDAHLIADRWVWRVSARVNGSLYIGNAEVMLNAAKNSPDGTNPFECAETSAFGRMLAFAGLGTVESIASYDEVMRGKPFVAMVEQSNERKVVEAGAKQKQLPPAQPQDAKARIGAIIKAGKEKALWNSSSGFLAYVSAVTGVNASGETIYSLSKEHLEALEVSVDAEIVK